MTAAMYIHDIFRPRVDHQPHITGLTFSVGGGSDLCIFLPRHVAEAMMAAFNDASVPSYDALLGFVEEVRDHKPTIHSGRHKSGDPAWDEDDLMPLDEFEAFQADAEALAGKKRGVAA
jgi:hypothetical protein